MAERRRYTRKQKLTAVLAADMSTTLAAATETAIPRSTLRYWMEDPEFATYRQKTREEMGEDIKAVALLALKRLLEALASGNMEPRDVIVAFGVLIDKAQLLTGQATERTELRDISSDLSDHERAQLRDALDRILGDPAPVDAGEAPDRDRAEVRQ